MEPFNTDKLHPQPSAALDHAIIAVNSTGHVTLWDQHAELLLGWKTEEILNQPISHILPDSISSDPAKPLHDFGRTQAWSENVILRRKDGAAVSVRMMGSPVGEPTGTICVLTSAIPAGKPEPSYRLDEQMKNSNSLLRRVLDTLPLGVSVVDHDRQLILSNIEEHRIWGQEAHVHETNAVERYLNSDDESLDPALTDGTVTLNEVVEIESLDGARKTLLSSAAPIRDHAGKIIGGIAVHQDITEQRRIEEAERKHRTFANALSGITAILTSSLDLETVMTRILDNVGRVVPHEAANIMLIDGDSVRIAFWHNYGPKCDEIFATIRYPRDLPMLRHMVETGLPMLIGDTRSAPEWVTFEETAWIRSTVGVPIRARDEIIGFLLLDSSEPDYFKPPDAERLRSFAYQAAIAIENARLFSRVQEYASELEHRVALRTAELRGAKDHVEAILENSSDGFALVTVDGAITQANPSFRKLFGLGSPSPDSVMLPDLVNPGARNQLTESFQGARTSGSPNRIELVCYRLDGSTFDADVAIAPLYDPTVESYFYICNVRDVTQQKTAERELRAALEREKQLSELKSQFIAMVSHEFRTPLASIQTSTDLLNRYFDKLTSERRGEIILLIQEHIQLLTALLEDVITVSKADTVGLNPSREKVNLRALCSNVIHELRETIGAHRTIDIEAPKWAVIVEVDAKLFRMVITNLLTNAIKYSADDSPIHVRISTKEGVAHIEVVDQGIGIPKDDLPMLFDPFFRARNVDTRQGLGLGLAIVERVIKAHQGTCTVESEIDIGTRFVVTIPKKSEQASA